MTTLKKPTSVEIRHSPGKGRGVFALRDLPKGALVERAPALIVPSADADSLLASFLGHYLFQTDDGRHYVLALGWVSMINHADKPNCVFFATTDGVAIQTVKKIPAGKEVTLDYGWDEGEWASITRRPAMASYFKVGDLVLIGKYKSSRARILAFGADKWGNPTVEVEPIPKGRKKNKVIGLFKIWRADVKETRLREGPRKV